MSEQHQPWSGPAPEAAGTGSEPPLAAAPGPAAGAGHTPGEQQAAGEPGTPHDQHAAAGQYPSADQNAPGGQRAGYQSAPADQPPPLTAFAWRSGLVRPTRGRVLAGVCGAFGRATNTDPVLWRVLLAVLAVFGGVGVLAYLLGWLLLPADGDTGSPVEALLGRGRSATSSALTVIGAVIVLLSFPVLVSEPFRPGPWAVILIGGALLLLLRDRRRGGSAVPPAGTGLDPLSTTHGAAAYPATSGAPMTSPTPQPAAPFAPHGPFVPASPPPYAPPTYTPVPPPPPRPPKPPRSRLGLLTFSVLLVVVGAMGLVDLSGYSIPGPSYFAAALAVVGLGLIVGAWLGRAHGLIALGVVLIVLTGGTTVGGIFEQNFRAGQQEWVITSFDQLEPSYAQDFGNATLDLSRLDFRTAPGTVTVDVEVNFGNVEIIVPPDVDVVVNGDIQAGNADVFDQSWGGIDPGPHSVTDLGDDGRGGGELHINATIDAGNLEVRR